MTDRRAFLRLSGAAVAGMTLPGCGGVDKIATPDVPRSKFGDASTAEEVTAGIDLSGKMALVTGCTSGIGFETMRVLALRGAHVIGTSRSKERAQEACNRVNGLTSAAQLELSDYDSIIALANDVRAINAPLDILVCNAGYLGGNGERQLVNGIEKHFAINHLGHYVLVNRLLGRLYMSWQGRIVVVASRAAYTRAPEAGIEFNNLGATYGYDDLRAYGQSKLANVLFALQLGKLLRGTRITANALHPGLIDTQIVRNMSRVQRIGFSILTTLGGGKSVQQGAATSCFVATSPLLGSTSGKYFEDCNAVTVLGDNHMHDEVMAEELWRVSEQLTREYLVSHDGPDLNDYEKAVQERYSGQQQ